MKFKLETHDFTYLHVPQFPLDNDVQIYVLWNLCTMYRFHLDPRWSEYEIYRIVKSIYFNWSRGMHATKSYDKYNYSKVALYVYKYVDNCCVIMQSELINQLV